MSDIKTLHAFPLALAAAVTFVGASARADTETVRLADGSVFSGELVEKVPGDHVTVKLATGEIRRVEWAALAPTPAAMAVAPTPPPPIALGPAVPPIHVDVTSDRKGALLMKVDRTTSQYGYGRESAICYAPCSADVDPTASYYMTGAYITQSSRFALPTGPARLDVRTGNSGLGAFGGWTLAFGILSSLFGAIDTPVAFVDAGRNGSSNGWNGWQYVGVGTLSAGAGLILLSIPFLVASLTHVSLGDMQIARGTSKVRWTATGLVF